MTPVVSFACYELPERNRQHDDANRDQDDPKHVAVGNAPGGKIGLRLPGALREFGEVFIAQLANGLVHLLVIEFGGLQRFLALLGRKQGSYSFFIRLTGLRWTPRVFAQIAQRNDVLFVLRPRRDSRRHEQSGEPQQTHTPLEARMHSSSYLLLAGNTFSLRIAPGHDKELLLPGQDRTTLPISMRNKRLDHFRGSGWRYFAASTDFHSPLIIP